MSGFDEISELLGVIEKVVQHGTMFPGIREMATRRLHEIDLEMNKKVAEHKNAQIKKDADEVARLEHERQAKVDQQADENEKQLEADTVAARKSDARTKAEQQTPARPGVRVPPHNEPVVKDGAIVGEDTVDEFGNKKPRDTFAEQEPAAAAQRMPRDPNLPAHRLGLSNERYPQTETINEREGYQQTEPLNEHHPEAVANRPVLPVRRFTPTPTERSESEKGSA